MTDHLNGYGNENGVRIIPTTGCNNCGGRCLLFAHVKDGRILKMSTQTKSEKPGKPPLCACAKGLNYHKTFLGEDRLKWPMKRVGERGEGCFERISWEEALAVIKREWVRIRDTYGPASRYVNYATGMSTAFDAVSLAGRLLSLDGGYLDRYNSYSTACITQATELMYGTGASGSSLETLMQSKRIILMGHNPAETRFDSATMYYLKKAAENGVPIQVIDPRQSDTALALKAEWIPIRPATDSALLDAMAAVIQREGMADQAFLDRYCLGFDSAHMPEGFEQEESVLDYLTGKKDGIIKDEYWAEPITGVPAEKIRDLAIAYAKAKPAALIQGFGAQRHAYGEQSARGAILLACMTGNIGICGGWAAGTGGIGGYVQPALPLIPNPCPYRIPSFRWTDAVDHGKNMGPLQGVKSAKRGQDGSSENLPCGIKMILNLAGNMLINQHADINRTAALLKDTSKCEFIVCSDLFMTPSAKFADILLPGVSMFECENLSVPWYHGGFITFANKVVEPLFEGRHEYEWLSELAYGLGVGEAFTCGRTQEQWIMYMLDKVREEKPSLPDYETFKREGIWYDPDDLLRIGFEEQIKDPQKYKFQTRSGRIELFSAEIAKGGFEEYFPAIPRYVEPPEGWQDPKREKYPLQLIGWHTKRRCHSIHDNNPELEKIDPQRLWIHPEDAAQRGIGDGDPVIVFNDRGKTKTKAHLTERIMRGVTALAQGAWYAPDKDGTDTNGSINVLTSQRPTPYARGNPQHTNLVEVRSLAESRE